jgi:hypothetical protein
VIGRAACDETVWRARVALAVDLGNLGGDWGSPVVLVLRAKTLAIGVEVVRGGPLLLKRPIAATHAVPGVVGGFHRATAASHAVVVALVRLGIAQAGAAGWLPDLHPWRKGILQEDAAVLGPAPCVFG